MRHKNYVIKTIIRIVGIIAMGLLLYHTTGQYIDFFIMSALTFWIIPELVIKIIFGNKQFDGVFLIDETDPTDVKMKLTMDTDMELVAKSSDIIIKVDHRVPNMSYNERSDDNV